jgi:hypothetical protein
VHVTNDLILPVFVNSRTEMSLQDQAEEYLMILRKGYKVRVARTGLRTPIFRFNSLFLLQRREMVHNNLGYTYFLLE